MFRIVLVRGFVRSRIWRAGPGITKLFELGVVRRPSHFLRFQPATTNRPTKFRWSGIVRGRRWLYQIRIVSEQRSNLSSTNRLVSLLSDRQLSLNRRFLEFEPRIEEAIKEEPVEVKVEETSEFIRSKPDITISNVVSNFRCRCHLNLRKIAITSKNCIYKR